jgi:HAE1 family hydrophobic/amphiphilic exporter-1
MGGVTGRLYQQFALTIAVSVLISAFNALTLSPALERPSLAAQGARRADPSVGLALGFNRGFTVVTTTATSRQPHAHSQDGHPALAAGLASRGKRSFSARRCRRGSYPTKTKGYAIIGVQLPDGASLQRTERRLQQIDAIIAKQPRRSLLQRRRRIQLLHAHRRELPRHGLHQPLSRGTERNLPSSRPPAIIRSLNGAFAAIPEARVFAVAPPAIPGISADGRLQHDAPGPERGLVRVSRAERAALRGRGPQAAGARRASAQLLSPAVPQLFADVDKDKVLQGGRRPSRGLQRAPDVPRRLVHQRLLALWRQWRVFLQAEPSLRTGPMTSVAST